MRAELLKVGMSQMSAGSRTDVGAYHRDAGEATQQHLGDLSGQFSLADHRSSSEVRGPCWAVLALGCAGPCWLPGAAARRHLLLHSHFVSYHPAPQAPQHPSHSPSHTPHQHTPPHAPHAPRRHRRRRPAGGGGPAAPGLRALLVHSLLPQGTHRRALHEDRQSRQHPQLLPPQLAAHAAGARAARAAPRPPARPARASALPERPPCGPCLRLRLRLTP
jgi:hypothetical protein